MRSVARVLARHRSFGHKVFEDAKRLTTDDDYDENDFTRLTSETIFSSQGKKVKLLAFPHEPISDRNDDLFEDMCKKFSKSLLLFDLKAPKLFQESKTASRKDPRSVREQPQGEIFDSPISFSELEDFVFETISIEGKSLRQIKKEIEELLLSPSDRLFNNDNVINFWIYNLLRDKENFDTQLIFSGMPQLLLHAKLSQFSEKGDLFVNFLNWTKLVAERTRDKTSDSPSGIFKARELNQLQLYMDSRFLRHTYLIETAKEVAKSSEKDLIIVADPLGAKAIRQILSAKTLQEEKDREKAELGETDEEREDPEYEEFINESFKNTPIEEVLEERRADKLKGIKPKPLPEGFLNKSIFQLSEFPDLSRCSEKEVLDLVFKMAVLEVFFDCEAMRSDLGSEKPKVLASFLGNQRRRHKMFFEKKFELFFDAVSDLRDNVAADINRFLRPQSLESALRDLKETARVEFENAESLVCDSEESVERLRVDEFYGKR